MADALCGPSNALSNFQKHSSVDRTLQQDRHAPQRSPQPDFRSAPGPSAGILDTEYEAFQAGQLPPFHELHQEPHFDHGFPIHGASQSYTPSHAVTPGWATDFQNLSLNNVHSSPAPVHQLQQFTQPQSAQPTGWRQEFMQQPNADHSFESRMRYGRDPSRLLFSHPGYHHDVQPTMQRSGLDQQTTDQPQPQDVLDDALFEQHFEAAALEASQNIDERIPLSYWTLQLELLEKEHKERLSRILRGHDPDTGAAIDDKASANIPQHDQAFDPSSLLGPSIQRKQVPAESVIDASLQDPIGSDLILEETQKRSSGKGKQAEGSSNEADELARTAGTLLENVQHDHSQKFKQSNFLSLMRQLRDREVRVEGDKLVDATPMQVQPQTQTQALHPGGEFYPGPQQQQPEM